MDPGLAGDCLAPLARGPSVSHARRGPGRRPYYTQHRVNALRVLVDARWVASAPQSSHARYLRALSAAWAELPNGPLVTLVGPGARPRDLVDNERIAWRRSPQLPGRRWQRPGSRMWLNTYFTAMSMAMHPDVLFFPWSVLPRALVAPAVVTVYDVCFRSHPDRFADGGRGGDAVLGAAVRSATEVVTPSAESKRGVVAAYGLDEQRVTIVRHGIAPTFRPAPAPGDADDAAQRWAHAALLALCEHTRTTQESGCSRPGVRPVPAARNRGRSGAPARICRASVR